MIGVHHIQLIVPLNCEAEVRRFYGELLELEEIPKPAELRDRGGVWFKAGAVDIHIGARKDDTSPSPYRHVALQVHDGAAWRQKLIAIGAQIEEAPEVAGWQRFYTFDPFGNKLEILQIL